MTNARSLQDLKFQNIEQIVFWRHCDRLLIRMLHVNDLTTSRYVALVQTGICMPFLIRNSLFNSALFAILFSSWPVVETLFKLVFQRNFSCSISNTTECVPPHLESTGIGFKTQRASRNWRGSEMRLNKISNFLLACLFLISLYIHHFCFRNAVTPLFQETVF